MVENDRAGLFTEGAGGFLPGVPLLGHGPHLSTPAPQSAELTHRWEPRPLARPRSKSRDLREASSEASRVDPTQAAAAAFRPDGPGCQIGTSRCTASGAAAARKAAPTIRALLFPVTREARTLLPI